MQKTCVLFFSLAVFSGCGFDRAAFSPFPFAPSSSSVPWNTKPVASSAHSQGEKAAERLLPEALPDQTIPLTLAEIIDIALKNNYSTKETWADARIAAAVYAQSQQNFFPSATANYNFDRSRSLAGVSNASSAVIVDAFGNPVSGTSSSKLPIAYLSEWGPDLSISYLIFDFGQTRASSQSALQALYKANLKHNREVQTVIQTATTDYYNYLYQFKLLESYIQDVADSQITLDAANAGLRAGVKKLSDVLQARSQLLKNQTNMVNQKQSVQIAISQLLTDMGLPAHLQLNSKS